jgi:hypothetical protein
MIKQISVFLENKPHQLSKCTKLLYDNNINIFSLTIVDNGDFGIIRFLVDKPEDAYDIFNRNNYTVNIKEVIAVQLNNELGSLYKISNLLGNNEINIEDSYGILSIENTNGGVFIFQTDNLLKARKVLEVNGYILKNII